MRKCVIIMCGCIFFFLYFQKHSYTDLSKYQPSQKMVEIKGEVMSPRSI